MQINAHLYKSWVSATFQLHIDGFGVLKPALSIRERVKFR